MILAILLAASQYILVQTLDGRNVYLNTQHIVSIGEVREKGQLSGASNCVLQLADGKIVAVVETCSEIQKRLGAAK